MTTSYKVLSAVPQSPWNTPDGKTLAVYSVGIGDAETGAPLTDDEGNPIIASIYTLPDKPGPEVGSILNNKQLKKNKKGYSLKGIPQEQQQSQPDVQTEQRIAQETFGGNQQPMPPPNAATNQATVAPHATQVVTAPMSKDDYWRNKEERDVEAQKRMGRAHAQEMALRALTLQVNAGMIPADTDKETFRSSIKGWTDWFGTDVKEAS